ncbi:MAG: alpha/beta hydrolase [Planctomycetaceae bacterium]|nr:alpha/beta hydrolase [Planctomycetaceae bacterium]
MLFFAGCMRTKITELRLNSKNPLVIRFQLDGINTPKMSNRARLTLRSYALETLADHNRLAAANQLHNRIKQNRTDPDLIYTFAELAYIEGVRQEHDHPLLAAELFAASTLYSYIYLFDPQLDLARNPYDPQFRDICLFYNGSLEKLLRLIGQNHSFMLDPSQDYVIKTVANDWNISVKVRTGKWRIEDIEQFRFAADYEIKGLHSEYRQHGLGVPLIACRKHDVTESPLSQFYPSSMSLPVTALLRPNIRAIMEGNQDELHAELEFFDPLESEKTLIEGRLVPLESDLTTPLAYFLSSPVYLVVGTVGVFDPASLLETLPGHNRPAIGLYMAQPYDPNKIPVILIHGLFSSPMTWVEMVNTLRSDPEIRDKYQFWFYLYPSGQPFWVSAAHLRSELKTIRDKIDPHHAEPALDRMVLVGHSMGGLIAHLQAVDSDNEIWKLVSHTPFDTLRGDEATRQAVGDWFFFEANPSVKHVVTIATPFRGSKFSNNATQWLVRSTSKMPKQLTGVLRTFSLEHRDQINNHSLLDIENGIESLSPDSPFFEIIQRFPRAPWVQYHNVVGETKPNYPTFGLKIPQSDGVVRRNSAEADWAESRVIIPSTHTKVHTHPEAIFEVRRILLDSLDETQYRSKTQAVPQPHQRTPYHTHPLHRQTVPPLHTPQQTVPPLHTPQRQGQPEPMRQVAVPQMLTPYFQMRNQVEM